MVFSSLIFLFLFLTVNIAVYFVVPVKYRNAVLLVTSVVFYGWGEPLYIAVMIFSVLVAYVFGYFVGKYRQTDKKRAKICMIVSTVLNLAALLFFKYYNFFAGNFGFAKLDTLVFTNGSLILIFVLLICGCCAASLLINGGTKGKTIASYCVGGLAVAATALYFILSGTGGEAGAFLSSEYAIAFTLPIGISFYTFQIMSYTFDVYRSDGNAQKSIVPFAAYVTLFPQLIAGPIVRYKDIDDQLSERTVNTDKFARGIRTFTAGLAKKVILADGCAMLFESLRAASDHEPTALGAWMCVIAFTFQIYFDFSGYSDMAIGLGRMFGFEFLENFNYPYISASITEFWRRWHISLSTWFKEYVYIPLGGNRKGLGRQFFNIAVVWFITGFWHGASWNYIIWGVYFGAILILEKLFMLKVLKKLPAVAGHIYALLLIVFGWLIFAFEDIGEGVGVLGTMFGAGGVPFVTQGVAYDLLRYLPLIALCVFGATPLPKKIYTYLTDKFAVARYLVPAAVGTTVLLAVAYMVDSSFSPFLYFIF